jgi:hypothetical protein
MKELLKKIAEQRRRLLSMGVGRLDCTDLEIRQVESASMFNEENAKKWLIANQHIAYKVCPAKMFKEKGIIFNIK